MSKPALTSGLKKENGFKNRLSPLAYITLRIKKDYQILQFNGESSVYSETYIK